jgi:ketosteroid isomerase-like protein
MTNTELVQSLYDAFARADVATVLEAFAPDMEWREAENFIYGEGKPFLGPQAILQGALLPFVTEWEGFSVTPENMVAEGGTVIVLGRYRGVYRATGVRVDAPFAHVWTVGNGVVTRFQQYTDTFQFREAVTSAGSASV